ncbi:sensor histidine kinase [Cohnella caldifontis]|uniref:sensor histidine kinase n=1 Tax=Cohnella caldifontis TaxID=3027471 RepID=UPI0023EDF818|nr:histidine kinase [Cohnella sp. YIM B05605]
MSFLNRHGPFIRIFTVILLLLLAAGWAIGSGERESEAEVLDTAGWQWAPAASWDEPAPPAEGWSAYSAPVGTEYPFFWLRVPLPGTDWKDPVLFMLHAGGNRVMLDDGKVLFENDPARKGIRVNNGFYWYMAPLPSPVPAQVDILMRNGLYNPAAPELELGEKSSFVSRILFKDLDNVILGLLLIFGGLVSLGLFASQRDRIYLYFSLLAVSGGYGSLAGNQVIGFLWDNPWASSLQETAMPWGTLAVIGALEQVFIGIGGRSVRWMRRFVFVFCVMATIGAVASQQFYTFWISYLYTPVFLAVFVQSYWVIWKAYRTRNDLESIWVMAGFTSLVAIGFVHVIRYWLPPGVYEGWPALRAFLDRLPEDLIYLGLFAFAVCLIRIIIHRYTAMHRQLNEVNRSLERLVEKRTAEIIASNRQLEAANEHLAASQRESAEAMAEALMLEERHRVTGAIHDAVGHTLSAAIIQLEAARRLLPLDRPQAEEKLAASQELARQGLEDIRHSVRLLREDSGHFDLHGALGALIRETEQTTGCIVESRIEALPDSLSAAQKRILFRTLQEGLTNGIKLGSARRFRFQLSAGSGTVRLRLSSDAKLPSSEPGLSLSAVMDRVSRLGGELRLDTTPAGCVLTLSLPA